MSIANLSLGLDPKVEMALHTLSRMSPTWAQFNGNARTYDVTLKTNVIYANLEGFAIRMWSSLKPEGPCTTIVVGASHVRPLSVEVWPGVEKPFSEVVTPEDRPEDALVAYDGGTVEGAINAVMEVMQAAYTPKDDVSPVHDGAFSGFGLGDLIEKAVRKP